MPRVMDFPTAPGIEIDILLFDFDVDSAGLQPEHTEALRKLIDAIGAPGHAKVTVSVDGFASRTGSEQHNRELSRRREQQVIAFLRSHSSSFGAGGSNRIDGEFHGFTNAPPGENPMFRSVRVVVHPLHVTPAPIPVPVNPPQNQQRRLTVTAGTISWIDGSISPVTRSLDAKDFAPSWVPKTYIGLAATSNPRPPSRCDLPVFRSGRQFRSMSFARFEVEIDTVDKVSDFKLLDAFTDPGFTPPFNVGKFPLSLLGAMFEGGFLDIVDRTFQPGENGASSLVVTMGRHANTVLPLAPTGEVVLINSLVKFRAGPHTDDIGVNTVKAPFHVPWVWCEMLLTYAGGGNFRIVGKGSEFPSHAWFLNDEMVASVPEVADAVFPLLLGPRTSGIDVPRLRLFPVLSAGAPASGAQSANVSVSGPVSSHPNGARAGRLVVAARHL